MKEEFFYVGYSNLLKDNKYRANWTSSIIKIISRHKMIFCMLLIICLCFSLNFWLIFRFVNILQSFYI